MSVVLDRAIEQFEDETLDLSMGERIAILRNALMWDAYHKLKAIGKKRSQGLPFEEDQDHLDRMKYFKDIERMYISELNMIKRLGKSTDSMDKEFLKRIKEEKSSIGEIVRDISPINKTA